MLGRGREETSRITEVLRGLSEWAVGAGLAHTRMEDFQEWRRGSKSDPVLPPPLFSPFLGIPVYPFLLLPHGALCPANL